MKTVVMILGLLLLGAMAYFGYSYGTQKSTEVSMKKDNEVVVQKIKSVQTEVVEEPNEEKIETDIAVKSSIVEEIPSEEMEDVVDEELAEADQAPEGEEDIIEDEDNKDAALPENIDEIVAEQEALMDEVVEDEHGFEKIKDKEEFEKNKHIKSFSSTKKDEMKVEQDLASLETETEEEKIIREEEAMNQAAINEDNISE